MNHVFRFKHRFQIIKKTGKPTKLKKEKKERKKLHCRDRLRRWSARVQQTCCQDRQHQTVILNAIDVRIVCVDAHVLYLNYSPSAAISTPALSTVLSLIHIFCCQSKKNRPMLSNMLFFNLLLYTLIFFHASDQVS